MSLLTQSAHGSYRTLPLSENAQPGVEIPPFLQTAGKVVKLLAAALMGIVSVASFGVGITLIPFSKEAGTGAFALSAALLTAAGYLLYNGTSSGAQSLSSRDIAAL